MHIKAIVFNFYINQINVYLAVHIDERYTEQRKYKPDYSRNASFHIKKIKTIESTMKQT